MVIETGSSSVSSPVYSYEKDDDCCAFAVERDAWLLLPMLPLIVCLANGFSSGCVVVVGRDVDWPERSRSGSMYAALDAKGSLSAADAKGFSY